MCQSGAVKLYKSTADLVSLLADDRGLGMSDRASVASTLRSTNYYRFTGYSRYFQVDPRRGDDNYLPGSTFESIHRLMLADDELRMRLLVPLSEVEQRVRTRFAHVSGKYLGNGSFYLKPENHISDTAETLNRIRRVREDLQTTKHLAVAHYRNDEDVSGVPIWVAVEVLSFGKISWLIESLDRNEIRHELADFFSYTRATFPRVLQSLSALRNLCAHHGQVWNRYLTAQCPLPLNKRDRPRNVQFNAQGLLPALLALGTLVAASSSKSQLAIVNRRLQRADGYADGVLTPAGVR